MTENEILDLKKCVVKDTKITQINISVFIVAKACFNDERLVEDLNFDSLALMMMSMEIEDEFNFRFTELVRFETVGDACDYLETHIGK